MWVLTLRDLQHRALRFGLAIFGTALLFAVVVLVSGIAAGFSHSANRTVEAINPGTWVLPEGSSGAFTSFAAFDAGVAETLGGSGEVAPLVVMRGVMAVGEASHDIVLVGHEVAALGAPTVAEGRAAQGPGETVVAEAAGIAVGEIVAIGGRNLEVVGIADGMTMFAGTPLVLMPIEDARAIAFEGQPVATAILSSGEVTSVPAGFHALTAAAIADDGLRLIEDAVGTISIVSVLLWIVAASVIGAVIYLSALERLRDFAVLKAMGARSRTLLGGVTAQAVFVAALAAGIAVAAQRFLVPIIPLDVHVSTETLVRLPVIAVVVGVIASIGALRQTVRVDPAAAFSGPGR
jgi:putative ABC transport system permease protein